MKFEVIPGGLLFADDVPTPDKPSEEWTEEENEDYHRYLWENAEPGTMADTLKKMDLSAENLSITIKTLEEIRNRTQEDATSAGYKSEWEIVTPEELLSLLILRSNQY